MRVLLLLASIVLACGDPPARDPAETLVLTPGATFPRALTGAGPLRFRFKAEADRFLHLDVEQRGIDVVVLLRDPSGRLLFEVDSPTGKNTTETVLAVTPATGEYLLVVEPFAPEAKGDVVLQVRELRPASREDRVRASAAAAFARAERRYMEGDFERAAPAYREAFPLLDACGERERAAEAEWHLGEALLETGKLRQAAAVLERAATRFRGLGDGVSEARASNDLGTAWRTLGEPGRALSAHQRALHLYRAAKSTQGEATTLHNLGLLYKTTGDLQAAIVHYEAALALWRRLRETSSEAVTLQGLGSLYSLIGHDDEALDLLRKALALVSGEEDERQRIPVLMALGWAQYLAGRPEVALDRFHEALALAERFRDRRTQAGIWDRQGTVLRALGRYKEAAESYSRALERSRAAGSRLSEGHTLANLGWLDLETGAVSRARQRLQRAIELLATSGDPNGEVYARLGLSRAERRLGSFGPAREHAEAALRLVEEMRTGLRGPASRGHFLATRFDAYEELATLWMDLDRREPSAGHARKALEVAERARARNLSEELGTASTPLIPHPLAPSPVTGRGGKDRRERPAVLPSPGEREGMGEGPGVRGHSLRAEIQALDERRQSLAARDPKDPRLQNLDAELRARWLELDRLDAAPRPALTPLTTREIQTLADEETLLVVYLLAEPASFAWTVDRESVVSHVLPGRERIEQLARRLVAAMPRSHEVAARGSAERAAQALSAAILAPLGKRFAGRRRLAILADGALHLVPFAALPEQTAEPLLVRHEIVMVPSATVLLAQRKRLSGRSPAPGTVAALGDPVFSRTDIRLSGSGSGTSANSREGIDPGPLP
ncbi:MAG TPA: tetratricopeptide repeat protein, partial [Thermoanaerobaculia bacterium]